MSEKNTLCLQNLDNACTADSFERAVWWFCVFFERFVKLTSRWKGSSPRGLPLENVDLLVKIEAHANMIGTSSSLDDPGFI